jgi:Tol biopolymer transport system component
VSISSHEQQGDAYSDDGFAMSPDGRFVAFASDADNLVPHDRNSIIDVFVRDRQKRVTRRVSISTSGSEARHNYSYSPTISADGRFVAFESFAHNLVEPHLHGRDREQAFIRDRRQHTTQLVSVSSGGDRSKSGAYAASISLDGHFVAFVAAADLGMPDSDGHPINHFDGFVRDVKAGTTELITKHVAPLAGIALSAHGRYVAEEVYRDLLPGDENHRHDIIRVDRETGISELVSVSSEEVAGDAASKFPMISANGRYIAFVSKADNLVLNDTNGQKDVFVRDMLEGTTTRVSLGRHGTECVAPCDLSALSSDGRHVAFDSARGLVPHDDNRVQDVYYRRWR